MQSSRLDEGEASLSEVAQRTEGSGAELLVDESYAFSFLQEEGMTNVACLAQALHHLEAAGHIPSCKAIMEQLVRDGHYGWAKPVRAHYLQWCDAEGLVPVL